MQKYVSLFICGLMMVVIASLLVTPSPAFSATCETRASWINDYAVTRSNGDTVLNEAAQANLNTLFVLAPTITNQNGVNQGYTDPTAFANFIAKAKARGFSVHGWITNMYRTSSVDFTSAVEQQMQADWTVSLIDQYPALDGVHFDYIRYSYGTIDAARIAGVTATVQKAHAALKAKYPNKLLTAATYDLEPNYASASEPIPQWFKNWFAANPNNWYQNTYGDGTNNVPQFFEAQQDAAGWVLNNAIEGIVPMTYGMNDVLWNNQAGALKSFVTFQSDRTNAGIMGMGYLTESGQSDWGYDPAGIVRKIKYGRSIGITGFSIFELSGMVGSGFHDDTPLIQALTTDSSVNNNDAPFKTSVSSCLLSSTQQTATPTKTSTPASTNTPVPPTATPIKTSTPVPPTATPIKTSTPVSPTATPIKTSTPNPTPASSAMYMDAITPGKLVNGAFIPNTRFGRGEMVVVQYHVVDANRASLSGVTVLAEVDQPDHNSYCPQLAAVTDANGIAQISCPLRAGVPRGTWTAVVLDATKSGYILSRVGSVIYKSFTVR